MKIAIIGAGVSGLCVARLLNEEHEVVVFEKESQPGGLIKCRNINGSLFHTCGGHVFNSKRQDVLDWFWNMFDKDVEFTKADRNSVVFMEDGDEIPYPIENHMYLFSEKIQKEFIDDLVNMASGKACEPTNFEEFLKGRFGHTLYELYFKPYNEKVWRRDLKQVPLSWLEGKLPMPTVAEMIFNNINHVKEKAFVHSSFWYENENGSQFLADKMAEGLNVIYNKNIDSISYCENKKWMIKDEIFDRVVFCGNIKDMVNIIMRINIERFKAPVAQLEYHGTTSVFCEIDANPYSWIYQPSKMHESHRIICTGNFSKNNNGAQVKEGRITATIEFTDEISREEIIENISKMPLNPKYIDHKYNKYTYPIQDNKTRLMIADLKSILSQYNFFFTGRFADWEYYNMDVAMGAAMDLCKSIK